MIKHPAAHRLYFPRAFWIALLLLCIFSIGMWKLIVHQTPADRMEYQRLMTEANPDLSGKNHLAPYTATQERQGIRKDYFFSRGADRLLLRLLSKNATLMVQQLEASGSSLIEKMQDVRCHMQEGLYYLLADDREVVKHPDGHLTVKHHKQDQPAAISPEESASATPMQQIRYFEAKEASYNYKTDQFHAEKAKILHYTSPGHDLPITPTISQTDICGNADSMDFSLTEGKKLTLSGSVSLDHELGQIAATEATIYADPHDKKLSIGSIELLENVQITSKEGSQLTCDAAHLDYKKMIGNFTSKGHAGFVTYSEGSKNKNQPPLIVKSRSMQAQISRQSEKGKAPSSVLSSIVAVNDVNVDYNQNSISADKGVYQRQELPHGSTNRSALPGIIILSMDTPEALCHLNSANGDRIDTPMVHIDTVMRTLHLSAPKGEIQINQGQLGSHLAFAADDLFWELPRDLLRLSENVILEIPGSGTLQTDQDLEIYYHHIQGKRQLRSIECHGDTLLTRPEKIDGYDHQLQCYGHLTVDHEKMVTTIDSPVDAQGIVPEGMQVVFRDSLGEIHADKILIYYRSTHEKISPEKMVAIGHVYMLDRKGMPAQAEASLLHYALANSVEYTFDNKEALFSGTKKNRVLFYDKVNNMQMSAPALRLKRDGANKKESIQGIGDVRLSFLEKEVEQIKRRFEPLPHRY